MEHARNFTLRWYLVLIIAAGLLYGMPAFGAAGCCPAAAAESNGDKDEEPQPAIVAMDFTLKDVDGKEVSLKSFKGKIVVLEWLNYDCPFVKHHYTPQKQTMVELAKNYAKSDVVWLGINSTHYSTAESTKAWAEGLKMKHRILMDTDGKVGKLFDAKTTPHVFIFDKKGNLAYKGAFDNAPMGRHDGDYVNYTENAIKALVADKPVEIKETKPYGCTVKYPPKAE